MIGQASPADPVSVSPSVGSPIVEPEGSPVVPVTVPDTPLVPVCSPVTTPVPVSVPVGVPVVPVVPVPVPASLVVPASAASPSLQADNTSTSATPSPREQFMIATIPRQPTRSQVYAGRMSITLYYGSGSPYAWKIWLALEHKQLPYEFKLLSFDRNEHRSPEFLAINPRGKVPALTDGDLKLWESGAILEYLEDAYPERPLLPRDARARARVRRITAEADTYLYPLVRPLFQGVLYKPAAERDPAAIASAQDALVSELERFAGDLRGDWFGDDHLSLADLTIYPQLRLAQRIEERVPEHPMVHRFPPAITAFMRRMAALPYHDRTLPPHWKA